MGLGGEVREVAREILTTSGLRRVLAQVRATDAAVAQISASLAADAERWVAPGSTVAKALATGPAWWVDTELISSIHGGAPGRLTTAERLTWIATALRSLFESLLQSEELVVAALGWRWQAITGISVSEGETHRGGRTVVPTIDGRMRLVLKPTNALPDLALQRVVADLRRVDVNCAIPLPHVLVGAPAFGIRGFVSRHHAPLDAGDADQYGRVSGRLIAWAWVMGLSDLHLENVVATREGPVSIDVECMFGRTASPDQPQGVLRSGLVQRLRPGALALSAYQGGGRYQIAQANLATEPCGRLRYRVPVLREDNQILLQPCAEVSAASIVDGFRLTITLFRRNEERMRRSCESLLRQEHMEMRSILRFTLYYVYHLLWLAQPGGLNTQIRSQGQRTRLCRDDTALGSAPPDVLEAEWGDSLRGDVPYFTEHPLDRDIRHASCGVVWPDVYQETAMEALCSRLEMMTDAWVHEQCQVLEEAMSSSARPVE